MATDRTHIGYKFENGDIPSQGDFQEVFNSFIHKDEDKADFQMVETGTDDQHYVTPALLRTGLQNIGIITGNSYTPYKEQFDNFIGNSLPLKYPPVRFSVKAFKNGQLLFEREGEGNEGDYIINYDNAVITFSSNIETRNIEVAYWYKNLSPNPGGGSGSEQIDFTSFLHTSGNETKDGILTFNNTTPTSTSGIVLTNSGADAGAKILDVTVSGAGKGISVQNTAIGTGIQVLNSGAGTGVQLNSTSTATGDPLKVTKDNIVKAKIDSEGIVTAKRFVSEEGTDTKFVKGDGSLDPKTYAEDTKVIHIEGNEERDGSLKLTHDNSVEDVLTITKNNSANCLKLVQNSTSSATTSTIDTSTDNVNRKAISIQKKEIEKAFITHDGNFTGTSFTTLNEKADITDGLVTLAASDSATTATAGHAKLYAKTDVTTDLYVMGSDGVEKKIGGEVDLSGVLLTTTDQSFSGNKSVTKTDDSLNNGLSGINNATSGSVFTLENNSTGDGLYVRNNSTGIGTYTLNQGNGIANYINNSSVGKGLKIYNNGQFLSRGCEITNYNDGLGFYLEQYGSGYGAIINNLGGGVGLSVSNMGLSSNYAINVDNQSKASYSSAINIINHYSGDGITLLNLSNGDAIVVNTAEGASGYNFVGQNQGTTTFSVNKTGNVKANSFVKTGGTSSQYLMADGSTSTLNPQTSSVKEYIVKIKPEDNSLRIFKDDIGSVTITRSQPYGYFIESPNITGSTKVFMTCGIDSNTNVTENRRIDYKTQNNQNGQIVILMFKNNALAPFTDIDKAYIDVKITIYG